MPSLNSASNSRSVLRRTATFCGWVCALFLVAAWFGPYHRLQVPSRSQTDRRPLVGPRTIESGLAASYGKLPLSFELNHGQTDTHVKFLSRGNAYTVFLTGEEAVLALREPSASRHFPAVSHPRFPRSGFTGQVQWTTNHRLLTAGPGHGPLIENPQPEIAAALASGAQDPTPDVVCLRLVGANPNAAVTGGDELPGKANYFIGNDPSKWRTNVPTYAQVRYRNLYPGVDLLYYGNQGGQLEYDFVVAPHADPAAITLGVKTGPQDETRGSKPDAARSSLTNHQSEIERVMQIAADGDLLVHVEGGELRFHRPVIYQPSSGHGQRTTSEGRRIPIEGRYVLVASNQVRCELGPYDRAKPLVIDPVLSYSTYLGGSAQDYAAGIAVDSSGNAYVTGSTYSADFPVTPGAYGATAHGGNCPAASPLVASSTSAPGTSPCPDAFVAKLNAAGSALVYSTYLGGSNSDGASGIVVDSSGNAYVTGGTSSTDFPTVNPLQARLNGTSDAFVAKLNASGSALIYSTYLGGGSNDSTTAIALDSSGSTYVTGWTHSTDFPTANPLQATNEATVGTAFVAKLNATGSALVYSTYLGGSRSDSTTRIAVDSSGNTYVTGWTNSTDFPTVKPLQAANKATFDTAFVAKLNAAGSALVYSTYLGGGTYDFATGIAVDSSGNTYVTGWTYSTDFPTANPLQATNHATGGTAFVADLNATGSALVYSTYLGGSKGNAAADIAVDSSGSPYVVGWTNSTDFPIVNPVQPSLGGGGVCPGGACPINAFLAKLNAAGSALVYSTYLGGSGDDQATVVALDPLGNAYVAGYTDSTDFPAINPLQASLKGLTDTFVAKLSLVNLSATSLSFGGESVNSTSTEQSTTLANGGDSTLTFVSIATSGDFALVTTGTSCPYGGGSVASQDKCTIDVTFTPKAAGSRTGTVTITDNDGGKANSTQTVSLTGTGEDFSLSANPASNTVTPGGTVTYTLSVAALDGFNQSVGLTCTGAPPESTCSISQGAVTPASAGTNVTVTVTTTAPSVGGPRSRPRPQFPPLLPGPSNLVALAVLLAGATWAIRGWRGRPAATGWPTAFAALAAGLLLTLAVAGCGGGGGGGAGNPGTPAGPYTLTVTGSFGSASATLTHSVTLALTVS